VLGVPLPRLGVYMMPPMVVGMAGKLAVTALESALLARGVARLTIRKLANTIASVRRPDLPPFLPFFRDYMSPVSLVGRFFVANFRPRGGFGGSQRHYR
jgi:hypothetical protein